MDNLKLFHCEKLKCDLTKEACIKRIIAKTGWRVGTEELMAANEYCSKCEQGQKNLKAEIKKQEKIKKAWKEQIKKTIIMYIYHKRRLEALKDGKEEGE